MKLNRIDCEEFKPANKNGQKEKCYCKYLNRGWGTKMKLDKMAAALIQYELKGKANEKAKRSTSK